MKKTLQELEAIRKNTLEQINLRKGKDGYRVVVGMATCGIAAGARPVMMKMMEAIENKKLTEVTIAQTGCIGACTLEPIVEVYSPDGNKVTYVKVDEEKAVKIVEEHLMKGNIIQEYMMVTIDGKVIDPKIEQ
ncbi:MAG: (2Fe-2S) ferredoxin domain-containing protein [Eubacteriales bacterium]